jgi:pimeloyl-ACP methyl ester carboxylesterase
MGPTMERLSVDGAELEVAVQGLGETIVFVHGAGFADSYLSLADDPAVRDHYRTIRYRRRGHGGSSPVDGPMPVWAHASDCRALLAALGVGKAHVVGHSYGGAVALQLAVDAPEVVATLALFEPGLLAVPSGPQFFEAVGPIVDRYSSGDRVGAVHAFFAAVGGPDWRSHEGVRARRSGADQPAGALRARVRQRADVRRGTGSSALLASSDGGRRGGGRYPPASDGSAC